MNSIRTSFFAIATLALAFLFTFSALAQSTPSKICDLENLTAELISVEEDTFTISFTNSTECEYAVGATSYTVPVDGEGDLCTWQNDKLDCQTRYAYQDIVLDAGEVREITVAKPTQCYSIDWYFGNSVEQYNYNYVGDPLYSYVTNVETGEDRLIGSWISASVEECGSLQPSAPSCSFSSDKLEVVAGDSVTLSWVTNNTDEIFINNGIGAVPLSGSETVTPLFTSLYILTALDDHGASAQCQVPIEVLDLPVEPYCGDGVVNQSEEECDGQFVAFMDDARIVPHDYLEHIYLSPNPILSEGGGDSSYDILHATGAAYGDLYGGWERGLYFFYTARPDVNYESSVGTQYKIYQGQYPDTSQELYQSPAGSQTTGNENWGEEIGLSETTLSSVASVAGQYWALFTPLSPDTGEQIGEAWYVDFYSDGDIFGVGDYVLSEDGLEIVSTDYSANALATYTLTFTTQNALNPGETLVVGFDFEGKRFNLSQLEAGAVSVVAEDGTVTQVFSDQHCSFIINGQLYLSGIDTVQDVITVRMCSNAGNTVAAGTVVSVIVGRDDMKVANPAEVGQYEVVVYEPVGVGHGGTVEVAPAAIAHEWVNIGPTESAGLMSAVSFAVDETNPSTLYAGDYGWLFKTTNGGDTWSKVFIGTSSGAPYAIAIHPLDSDIIILAIEDGRTVRTEDGGTTWQDMDMLDFDYSRVFSISFDPQNPLMVLALTGEVGLIQSDDGGKTWVQSNSKLPMSGAIKLVRNNHTPSVVYAVGQSLYKSEDNGTNWTQLSVPWELLQTFTIDPTDSNLLYAIGMNSARTHLVLYKSVDAGVNWEEVPTAAPSPKVLVVDPSNPSHMYAGGAEDGSRISMSNDGGLSWRSLKDWGDSDQVEDLEIKNGTLYSLNHSSGIWKLSLEGSGDVNSPPSIDVGDNPLIITVGTEFDPLEGVTATDVEDGDLTNDIQLIRFEEVNIHNLGDHTITYRVQDSEGEVTEVSRVVKVVEDEPNSVHLSFSTDEGYNDSLNSVFNTSSSTHPDKVTADEEEVTFKILYTDNKGLPADSVSAVISKSIDLSTDEPLSDILSDDAYSEIEWKDKKDIIPGSEGRIFGYDGDGFEDDEVIEFDLASSSQNEVRVDVIVEKHNSLPGFNFGDPFATYDLEILGSEGQTLDTETTMTMLSNDIEYAKGTVSIKSSNQIDRVRFSIFGTNRAKVWIENISVQETLEMSLDSQAEDQDHRDGNYENGEQFSVSSTFSKGEYTVSFTAANSEGQSITTDLAETQFFKAGQSGSVAFLPGIMGSNLKVGKKDVWPFELDFSEIELSNGVSKNKNIYTTEAKVGGVALLKDDMNEEFISYLDDLTIPTKAIPYDWRLDFDSIIEDGVDVDGKIYYASTSLSNLDDSFVLNSIKELSMNSESGKVTLVAHSMGGLIVKRLMKRLAEDELFKEHKDYRYLIDKIDKIVLVASPQIGTPEGVMSLLHGKDLFGVTLVASKVEMRDLGNESISAYSLMPSEEYFNKVKYFNDVGTDDFIERTVATVFQFASTSDAKDKIRDEDKYFSVFYDTFEREDDLSYIDNYTDMVRYATSSEHIDGDLRNPKRLLGNIIVSSTDTHSGEFGIDNWVVPDDTELYQIAGYGNDTVSGVYYKYGTLGKDELKLIYRHTAEGDATVVVPSAAYLTADNVSTYYVNLETFGFNTKHSGIMDDETVRTLIDQIVFKSKDIAITKGVTTTPPYVHRRYISVHSPVTIGAYDSQNNFTGIVFDDETRESTIFEEIPNSSYFEEAGGKYLSLEPGREYRIVMEGLDEGSFTFFAEEVVGMEPVKEIAYNDVPVETGSVVEITFNEDGDAAELQVDEDGDGSVDYSVPATTNYSDNLAPATTLTLTGTLLTPDTYLSTTTIILIAENNEGGVEVEKTEYSFDGKTWKEYAAPIDVTKEATTTIYYRSTDWFGNVEETKSVTFEIVSARGLIEETSEWIESQNDKKLKSSEQVLSGVLKSDFWLDRNTLNETGGHSVPTRLEYVAKALSGRGYETQADRIRLALTILESTKVSKADKATTRSSETSESRRNSSATRLADRGSVPPGRVLGVSTTNPSTYWVMPLLLGMGNILEAIKSSKESGEITEQEAHTLSIQLSTVVLTISDTLGIGR